MGAPATSESSSGVVSTDGAKAFTVLAAKDTSILCELTRIKGQGI